MSERCILNTKLSIFLFFSCIPCWKIYIDTLTITSERKTIQFITLFFVKLEDTSTECTKSRKDIRESFDECKGIHDRRRIDLRQFRLQYYLLCRTVVNFARKV